MESYSAWFDDLNHWRLGMRSSVGDSGMKYRSSSSGATSSSHLPKRQGEEECTENSYAESADNKAKEQVSLAGTVAVPPTSPDVHSTPPLSLYLISSLRAFAVAATSESEPPPRGKKRSRDDNDDVIQSWDRPVKRRKTCHLQEVSSPHSTTSRRHTSATTDDENHVSAPRPLSDALATVFSSPGSAFVGSSEPHLPLRGSSAATSGEEKQVLETRAVSSSTNASSPLLYSSTSTLVGSSESHVPLRGQKRHRNDKECVSPGAPSQSRSDKVAQRDEGARDVKRPKKTRHVDKENITPRVPEGLSKHATKLSRQTSNVDGAATQPPALRTVLGTIKILLSFL
ncbi:hypothetical protein BDQ17DRAFT_1414978 [Cyathus striatus]|nr:hypothetical protein BDQ17DRAFT_1414978 [Cyathus striatus]